MKPPAPLWVSEQHHHRFRQNALSAKCRDDIIAIMNMGARLKVGPPEDCVGGGWLDGICRFVGYWQGWVCFVLPLLLLSPKRRVRLPIPAKWALQRQK